jgi:hypothetical protein
MALVLEKRKEKKRLWQKALGSSLSSMAQGGDGNPSRPLPYDMVERVTGLVNLSLDFRDMYSAIYNLSTCPSN